MPDEGELSSLEDLIARAELEPDLRDLYVEGRRDAELLRHFFSAQGLEVGVFAVTDRLDLPRSVVEQFESDYGNRAKLVAAALGLANAGSANEVFTFLIDADWSKVAGPVPINAPALLFTDLPSMDHYFVESGSFQRVLSVGLSLVDLQATDVRLQMRGAMRGLAAVRLVLSLYSVQMIQKFGALCAFTGSVSSVSSVELVRRSLNAAGRSGDFDRVVVVELLDQYENWLDAAGHQGRGHDLAPVLVQLLGLKGDYAKVDNLETLLRTSTSPDELADWPVFKQLIAKFR